jgi:hypothetical protein
MNPKTQERVRRIVEKGKFDPERFRRRVDFSHRFLLFIPVETQRSRRILVVGYYLFFIAFAAVLLWFRGPAKYDRLLPLTFYLATALGGLSFSGPVRLFSVWQRNLHSAPRLDRLDEHDIAVRDRAHYLAYSVLRWPAIVAALFGGIFLMDMTPAQFGRILVIASVPVAALFFSLPQAIILWTEPDLEPETSASPTTLAGAAQ